MKAPRRANSAALTAMGPEFILLVLTMRPRSVQPNCHSEDPQIINAELLQCSVCPINVGGDGIFSGYFLVGVRGQSGDQIVVQGVVAFLNGGLVDRAPTSLLLPFLFLFLCLACRFDRHHILCHVRLYDRIRKLPIGEIHCSILPCTFHMTQSLPVAIG